MYYLMFFNREDRTDKVQMWSQEEMRDVFANEELTVLANGLPLIWDEFIIRDMSVCTRKVHSG